MKIIGLAALSMSWTILPGAALAQCGASFVEGFTQSGNHGNWVWHGILQQNPSTAGNPGYWVGSVLYSTDRAWFRTTQPASLFCGDYRAQQVSSVGIDFMNTHSSAGCDRPLTLLLHSDNGTPGFPGDDFWVSRAAGDIPCADGEWRSYTFDVPSSKTMLPAGWKVSPASPHGPDPSWNLVMQGVTRLEFQFGDPLESYPVESWVLGADNARIGYAGGPTSLCRAQRNSLGCSTAIGWFGQPSASSSAPFFIEASQLRGQQSGMLFYGFDAVSIPFLGGELCVGAPIRRTALQVANGPATECEGQVLFDFNAHIQMGVDAALFPGRTVFCQYWSRDSGAPAGSNLSNALRFAICP
jgi:hypothetical protein